MFNGNDGQSDTSSRTNRNWASRDMKDSRRFARWDKPSLLDRLHSELDRRQAKSNLDTDAVPVFGRHWVRRGLSKTAGKRRLNGRVSCD